MIALIKLWILCGLIVYIYMLIKRLREPNGFNKLKGLYIKDGIVPFIYGLSAILLGPLILIIPLWLNKK